jgi:translation initiation factor 2 alpha subunit (eIF-2alpha)
VGLLETLLTFLPDFNFETGDIIIGGEKTVEETNRRTVIVDCGDGKFVQQTEDANVIDVGEFDEQQYERAQEALVEEWESVEEVFRESTADDKQALESGVSDEEIHETLSYFRTILPKHYANTLEAALHMRKQEAMMGDVPDGWARDRRKDIAEKYDGHTYQIINLCSAGYFDEGRYLRQLYEEMREEEEYKEGDYAEVFEQIVAHRPFTIFVSNSQQASDVKQEIYSTVRNRERHDVNIEFVDVRGMGSENRQKIQGAVENIAEEVGDFQVDVRNEQPEMVLRIDPDTLSLSE